MATPNKQDSNCVGLAIRKETALGTVSTSDPLNPRTPNDYAGGFGTTRVLTARAPISEARSKLKGIKVDEDTSGGFTEDLTPTNFSEPAEGLFFAEWSEKGRNTNRRGEITNVVTQVNAAATNTIVFTSTVASVFAVDDIILVAGSSAGSTANDGIHVVTAVSTTTVTVGGSTLVADATPGNITVQKVGYEFAVDTVDVAVSSNIASLSRATGSVDWSTVPGVGLHEWVFIGGDAAGNSFDAATAGFENNTFARISALAADSITFDITHDAMEADGTGTATEGKSIRIFFGNLLYNRITKAGQVRSTYQVERSLGAPDDSSPSVLQADSLRGAIPNIWQLRVETADLVKQQWTWAAIGSDTFDDRSTNGAENTTIRPAVPNEDAFNTSDDFSALRMYVLDSTTSNPTGLVGYIQDMTLTIGNNIVANKAVSVNGAFDLTAGDFEVAGQSTAYFQDFTAVNAVNANNDVGQYLVLARNNKGLLIDIPLLALGDGRPTVTKDEPITLPLEISAGKSNLSFGHTCMVVEFPYLPAIAQD